MNVLVACEFSGVVRDAFRALGHAAVSCDLEPSERPGPHIQDDLLHVLSRNPLPYDLLIAFPPCTYLARSGARWHWDTERQAEALDFVRAIMAAPIPAIAIENPVGRISTAIRRPDQIIQPWQFGHGEVKTTCLWLKNLPLLEPTKIVDGREPRIWGMGPSKNRARERSRTYGGVALAMAAQWGST